MTRATQQAIGQEGRRPWTAATPGRATPGQPLQVEPLLALRGVGRSWRVGRDGCSLTVRALRAIDLEVHAGELLALAGAPGAGKTTLLLCAAGLARADEGVVHGSAEGRAAYVGTGTHGAWARLALAAVARGARLLLLDVIDAPVLASPRAVAALAGSIATSGVAVVVAARDPADLPAFAQRLVMLEGGRVVRNGRPFASARGGGGRSGRDASATSEG